MSKKILVIDDAPSVIQLMEYWLKKAGFEILVAQDGLAGFELAKKKKPDLILLDVMIPKLDGYSVCRLLKMDESYAKIPIILVTAREEQDDKDRGKEVGAEGYLEKPVTEEILLKKIKEFVKK